MDIAPQLGQEGQMMLTTWLPLPSFKDSVKSLNNAHLGLQRIQVLELMETFHAIPEDESQLPDSYISHDLDPDDDEPILNMWRGYELQLIEYGLECCEEYQLRKGKRDKIYKKLSAHLEWATTEDASFAKPNWFGDVDFHLSHQAELVRLDPKHYRPQFIVDVERELVWPLSDHNDGA
jgi:hypothetical protein